MSEVQNKIHPRGICVPSRPIKENVDRMDQNPPNQKSRTYLLSLRKYRSCFQRVAKMIEVSAKLR